MVTQNGTGFSVPQQAIAETIGSLQLENMALRQRIAELEKQLAEQPKDKEPAAEEA